MKDCRTNGTPNSVIPTALSIESLVPRSLFNSTKRFPLQMNTITAVQTLEVSFHWSHWFEVSDALRPALHA